MAINLSVQRNDRLLANIMMLTLMLLLSGNPSKSHEDILALQPMFTPKLFDIPPEVLDAFRFFL